MLLHDAEVAHEGAVGAVLRGVEVRTCVSQGARPIGPEMTITAAEGNQVHELASKPALVRLREAIVELPADERVLAANGLLLGIVIDENQPEYERGDFLVRGLLGADEETGAITVGENVRVGQTVRLHVRDGRSADEDLRHVLGRRARAGSGRRPRGRSCSPATAAAPRCSACPTTTRRARRRLRRRARRGLLLRRRDRAGRRAQLRARLHRDAGGLPG